MSDFVTEFRVYVGQRNTVAVDGYAGFRVGQQYSISYLRRYDHTVVLSLTHIPGEVGTSWIYLSKEQFERWWQPVIKAY